MQHDGVVEILVNWSFFLMNKAKFDITVRRPDEWLYDLGWPNIQKLEAPSISGNDCLLVCAGFEDRSIKTLTRVCKIQKTKFALGLISYLPEQTQNRIEDLKKISQNAGLTVTRFIYNRESPSDMGEKLRDFSQTFDRIFVDISGMSRLLIVQTLVALLRDQRRLISILYGEAQKYPPSKDEFDQDNRDDSDGPAPSYLSSGVFEIAATPELSSVSMLGEAIRLIAFPSFDPAQLSNLVQELQPTYTEFIHGIPPDQNNRWRTEAIRQINGQTLNELHSKIDHNASTLDYRETLKILLRIYAQRSMFDRLVVAPTGSKMQSVAVGLFRAVLHDVQIVYPTPQVFTEPENYTLGLRQLYQLDLPTDAIWDAIKNVELDEDEPDQVSQ